MQFNVYKGNVVIDDDISREDLLEAFRVICERLNGALLDVAGLSTQVGDVEKAHKRFIEVVAQEFHQEASNNNLCEAYDRAVERINETLAYEGFDTIPPRRKKFEVEVAFSGRLDRVRHTVRVEATSQAEAEQAIRAAALNGGMNDLLYEDGEFPHDTVDAVLTAGAQDEFFRDVDVVVVS